MTGNDSVVKPVVFYDFNRPPGADGLYRVVPEVSFTLWKLGVGDLIHFGCENDGVMAEGRIVGFDGPKVALVRETRWLEPAPAAESPEEKR